MLNKKVLGICCLLSLFLSSAYAQPDEGGIGQTIQIYTRLDSFKGKPSWLLVIRDIDHNQNIPYLFDIKRKDNFWVAFTYGRNYLITISNLQFAPYGENPYTLKKINNFCQLESRGRIIRGQSLYITIRGKLTPYSDTYDCSVSSYADSNFTIAKPNNIN